MICRRYVVKQEKVNHTSLSRLFIVDEILLRFFCITSTSQETTHPVELSKLAYEMRGIGMVLLGMLTSHFFM
jgi:hypothetical protein